MPELDEQIARGEFSGLFGWLRTNVHGVGAKVTVQRAHEDRHRQAAVGGRVSCVMSRAKYLEGDLQQRRGVRALRSPASRQRR